MLDILAALMSITVLTVFDWHRKLGQVKLERFSLAGEFLDGIPLIKRADFKGHQCGTCIQSASIRASICHSILRGDTIWELTHTNIFGKISQAAIEGAQCFVIFLDDGSAMSAVYILHEQLNVLERLMTYKALVEIQSIESMQQLCLNQAGERLSSSFSDFIHKKSIVLEFSSSFASQANNSSEHLI